MWGGIREQPNLDGAGHPFGSVWFTHKVVVSGIWACLALFVFILILENFY